MQSRLQFGPFELDTVTGELRKHGVRLRLAKQPFDALTILLEEPGRLVTREEFQKRLWPDGVSVDFERGINKVINRLRVVMGDDAEQPRFIETLPQRGYRFIGTIEAQTEPILPDPPQAQIATVPHAGIERRAWLSGGAAAILGGLSFAYYRATRPEIQSIAVLPLENMSGDPAQEYFSDGITDELIGELARIHSLRIISRTSTIQYKGAVKKPLPIIAGELKVDAIVEGSLARANGRVRVIVKLVRAADERTVWSESYERDASNVLSLQTEIAQAIAGRIRAQVSNRQAPARGLNPEAHEAYLRAVKALSMGPPSIASSMELFRKSIELDPGNAEAFAGLGEALVFAGIFELRPSEEMYPEARKAALRALELDPDNGPARNVLADVKKGFDWDFAGAEAEYRRAIAASPSHLLTCVWFGEMWSRLGRFEEAIAESRRARVLDPLSPVAVINRTMILWRARRFDEAITEGNHALEMDPRSVNGLWWLGLAHASKRDFGQSIELLQRASGLNRSPMTLGFLGHVLARAGRRDEALSIMAKLQAMSTERYVGPADFAGVHAGLGDRDATFQSFEEAFKRRNHGVHQLRFPIYDDFREDPRYVSLLRRGSLA